MEEVEYMTIDFLSGLFSFPVDESILQTVMLIRGIENVPDGGVYVSPRDRELIQADIYTIFADGVSNMTQSVGTADLNKKIVIGLVPKEERMSMKRKAQFLYNKWGELDKIESKQSVLNA